MGLVRVGDIRLPSDGYVYKLEFYSQSSRKGNSCLGCIAPQESVLVLHVQHIALAPREQVACIVLCKFGVVWVYV